MSETPPQDSDLKFDNMTRQDLKKIEKSMKRPEFLGLLNEYMIEISDPKNKNEYDQYLRQMEREKQLPKHMKIVELKPKFCFRTFIVSQKNKKHEMKFFVNMCQTEYLEKPSCEPSPGEDGKVGYSWKIPNSSGKIRYDQDKKGSPCQVIDVAFHPDTFYFAVRKQFQEMMINIALEAAEKQLGQRKESLSRDYVILKNVICKGEDGKPALMPIRYIQGKVYNKGQGPTSQPQRDNEGRETKLQREINKQKQEHDKQKKSKNQEKKQDLQEQKQEQIEENKLIIDLNQGVQRPKFTTIFTYPVDYSQFIDNPTLNKKKIPSAFNIQFAIPRIESISQVADQKLQINDKKIILKIGQKYFIDLELQQLKVKYALKTALAKAKYDKKKKSLRIIIPIDQSINYAPQIQQTKEKIDQPKQDIVEEELWKNKVLDFTEPSVSVKMLGTEKFQDKPKLIEEIDEEDVAEAPSAPKEPNIEDQAEEQIKKKSQKFTLSNYYKKSQNQIKNNLKYVFQETADKILLVFQMKNYKKEQIQTIVGDKKNFLIQWKSGERQSKFSHLLLKEQHVQNIAAVQIVQRVGFIAFTITKSQKGKYWEKNSITQQLCGTSFEEQKYTSFKQNFSKFSQAQQQIAIVESQNIKENIQPQKIEIEERKLNQTNKMKQKEIVEKVENKVQNLKGKSLFTNLQVQFINFDIPFIDILD